MYATHITVNGISHEPMGDVQAVRRSERLPSPLKEFITEMVSQGLVSDFPSSNCSRQVDEAAGTTTFRNATWTTQEAAQQFVDLYANNISVVSATVEPV